MPILSEFYRRRHDKNRIFVSAERTIYRNRSRYTPHPQFNVTFELFHRVLPDDFDQQQWAGYVFPEAKEVLLEFGSASAEWSVFSVKDMIARARVPFELNGQGNQLRWENIRLGEDSNSVPLHGGVDQVAARVSSFAGRVVREIGYDRTVSSVVIRVLISKRTVLPAPQFWLYFQPPDERDNGGGGGGEGIKAFQSLEKLTYSGDGDLICGICLEEVFGGMPVGRFPCNHMFHHHCIGKWLTIKTTCPLCRLNLITKN